MVANSSVSCAFPQLTTSTVSAVGAARRVNIQEMVDIVGQFSVPG